MLAPLSNYLGGRPGPPAPPPPHPPLPTPMSGHADFHFLLNLKSVSPALAMSDKLFARVISKIDCRKTRFNNVKVLNSRPATKIFYFY